MIILVQILTNRSRCVLTEKSRYLTYYFIVVIGGDVTSSVERGEGRLDLVLRIGRR